MVDAKPSIAWPAVAFVIPERIHRRVRMKRADRINPALAQELPEQRARFGLHERIILVGFRRIDIGFGGDDVIVACQHNGRIQRI